MDITFIFAIIEDTRDGLLDVENDIYGISHRSMSEAPSNELGQLLVTTLSPDGPVPS